MFLDASNSIWHFYNVIHLYDRLIALQEFYNLRNFILKTAYGICRQSYFALYHWYKLQYMFSKNLAILASIKKRYSYKPWFIQNIIHQKLVHSYTRTHSQNDALYDTYSHILSNKFRTVVHSTHIYTFVFPRYYIISSPLLYFGLLYIISFFGFLFFFAFSFPLPRDMGIASLLFRYKHKTSRDDHKFWGPFYERALTARLPRDNGADVNEKLRSFDVDKPQYYVCFATESNEGELRGTSGATSKHQLRCAKRRERQVEWLKNGVRENSCDRRAV